MTMLVTQHKECNVTHKRPKTVADSSWLAAAAPTPDSTDEMRKLLILPLPPVHAAGWVVSDK